MKNIKILWGALLMLAAPAVYGQSNNPPKARIMYLKSKADQTFTYGNGTFSDSTLTDLKFMVGPLDTAHRYMVIQAFDLNRSLALSDTVEVHPHTAGSGSYGIKTYPELHFHVDQGYILLLDRNFMQTDSLNIK